MSSQQHAKSLLAALDEVDKKQNVVYQPQTVTLFTLQPQVIAQPTHTILVQAPQNNSGLQIVSNNVAQASTSSLNSVAPLASIHLSPATYSRENTQVIPKKKLPPTTHVPSASCQLPTSPCKALNVNQGKQDVKLQLLKGDGDKRQHTVPTSAESKPLTSTRNWYFAKRLPETTQQAHQASSVTGTSGISLLTSASNHAGTTVTGANTTQCSIISSTGVSTVSTPCTTGVGVGNTTQISSSSSSSTVTGANGACNRTTPSGANGRNNVTQTSTTRGATLRGGVGSSSSTISIIGASSLTSGAHPGIINSSSSMGTGTSCSGGKIQRSSIMVIKSGVASSAKGAQTSILQPVTPEKKGSILTVISSEESDSSSEAEAKKSNSVSKGVSSQEALCSNCGIWSGNEFFCTSCGKDFTKTKPKKYRPVTSPSSSVVVASSRPSYRQTENNQKQVTSGQGTPEAMNTSNQATKQQETVATGRQDSASGNGATPVADSKTNPGITHKAGVQSNLVAVKSLPSATGTSKVSSSHSVKKFYVNKITDFTSAGNAVVYQNPVPKARMGLRGSTKKDTGTPVTSRKRPARGGRAGGAKRIPPKPKEPEIVLISDSDDEEEEKKPQAAEQVQSPEASQEESFQELPPSHQSRKARMRDQSGNLVDGDDSGSTGTVPALNTSNSSDTMAFNVMVLRFGSWPKQTEGQLIRLPAVSLSPDGFNFHFTQEVHKCGKIELLLKDIERCEHYLSNQGLNSFFITTTPGFAQIARSRLNMQRKETHFDPMSKVEHERLLVIRPMDEIVSKGMQSRVERVLTAMATKISSTNGLKFQPIDKERTNKLLVSSTRPEMRHKVIVAHATPGKIASANAVIARADNSASLTVKNLTKMAGGQGLTSSKAESTSVRKNSTDQLDKRLFVFPPPPKFGGITVTTEDRDCLADGEFLNDVIIDFYLKYVLLEKLNEYDRERTHLFSCFFYQRLMQSDHGTISPGLNGLTPKEKRHQKVHKWTRHVDIFSKDFVIIPINDCAHWFVAIICFAGQVNNKKKDLSASGNPSPASSSQASPAAPSPTPSDQSTNQDTPAKQNTRSHSEQSGQGVSDSGAVTNASTDGAHDRSQSANQERECANGGDEEEPMDTSESPDPNQSEDQESKTTTTNGKETETIAKDSPNGQSSSANAMPSSSAASGMATSTSAISVSTSVSSSSSSSSRSNSPANSAKPPRTSVPTTPTNTVQTPKVNGSIKTKKDILDFDYQAVHVGDHKRFHQPCILVFDSLAGSPRRNVISRLRDYLTVEWERRKGSKCEFTTANVKGISPKVPQQNNFSDCGLFVCQYVEAFFQRPINNYRVPMKGLQKWFSQETVATKREEIREVIQKLAEEYKTRKR